MNPPARNGHTGTQEPSVGFNALLENSEFRGPTSPSDDHEHTNDHLALIYEDRDEQFETIVPFIRKGLERGEQCLYVADDNPREEILEALRDGDIDVDSALESGALSVLTPADTYRRTGEFDCETMLGFWEDALDEAKSDGYTGIRAAAEMTWAIDDDTSPDQLTDYEALLNSLYEDDDYTVLCQYNRNRFPADVIDDVIDTHPLLIQDTTVSRNVYYTPPEKFFSAEDPDETVTRKLRTLKERTETKTALQEHKGYLQELYEITADGTLTFEEAVAQLLELGCEYFDLKGGALSHLPDWDGEFRAEVTIGPEISDTTGKLPVQPEGGCFCRQAISQDEPTAVPDVDIAGWDETATAEQFGFSTYFGMQVTSGTDPYGTLWFYDTSPRDEPFSDDERTFLELMGQWVSNELERTERNRAQRQLYEITADGDYTFEEKVERLLELGRDRFGLDKGFLLKKEDDEFHVIKTKGSDLEEGVAALSANSGQYCKRTITLDTPLGVEDTEAVGWDDDPLYWKYDLGCYLGTKVSDNDGVYGTLCFAESTSKTREFTDAEYTFLDLLGEWVSHELKQKQRQENLQQSKEQLERILKSSRDAIFIIDPYSDQILKTNPAGCEMLGYSEEKLQSLGPSDIHPAEMDQFRELVEGVYDDGSGWTEELTCRHEDGHRIPAEISASQIEYDDRQCMLAIVRDVSKRKEREQSQRQLYEIAADPDQSFDEKLQAILDLGCARFDMEAGGLAKVDPEANQFEVEMMNIDHDHLEPGHQYPLSETYCQAAVDDGSICAITTPEEYEGKLCYDRFGVRTYLGTHLELENTDDRTFWFVSSESRDGEFSESEQTFHHLMGQWVQYELEHQQHADQLAALNNLNAVVRDINRGIVQQSTREEIEQVVCEQLADSDSYEFAWVGRTDEQTQKIIPTTTGNAQGYLDDVTITADTSDTGQGPTGTALRTGETQIVRNIGEASEYEPWREQARERGFNCSAAIPIAYEDQQHGVLNVYTARERAFDDEEREVISQLGEIIGLAITTVEHERKLEHERERLEFINRLVRHNLLNSLNVVRARADILDGHVDPTLDSHLETVRDRTENMITLVETLRSLMKVVVKEKDHELEPIDLGTVLTDEVKRARQAFPQAEFEMQGEIEELGAVLADDLLGEVFENLLTNAVQHNDKDTPRITIDVENDDEMTAVRIADNGPGVPEEMKDRIFQKGEKSFDSPGTGFGLHLVREIIDAYDGSIAVEDDTSEGAVFTISVPRVEESSP